MIIEQLLSPVSDELPDCLLHLRELQANHISELPL